MTSPRPQISQREPETKNDSCRTCYDSSVYMGRKEPVSTNENTSENITRLHERQRELASEYDEKINIDVRYPLNTRKRLKLLIYYFI